MSTQWRIALLEWTKERRHPQSQLIFPKSDDITTAEKVPDRTSGKKRAAATASGTNNRSHKYCCIEGCTGNDKTTELIRVSDFPPPLRTNASRRKQITYHKKVFIRRERTERLMLRRGFVGNELRACKKHWEDVRGKSTGAYIRNDNGTIVKENITIPPFSAPRCIGKSSFFSPPMRRSKGNATDRATVRYIDEIRVNEYALGQQQLLEMMDVQSGELCLSEINTTICAVAGLDVHRRTFGEGSGRQSTSPRDQIPSPRDEQPKCEVDDSRRKPTRVLESLTPKEEVKRLTGFNDLKMLLSFAAVICDGDLTIMTRYRQRRK